jgi:hypothetical protein
MQLVCLDGVVRRKVTIKTTTEWEVCLNKIHEWHACSCKIIFCESWVHIHLPSLLTIIAIFIITSKFCVGLEFELNFHFYFLKRFYMNYMI